MVQIKPYGLYTYKVMQLNNVKVQKKIDKFNTILIYTLNLTQFCENFKEIIALHRNQQVIISWCLFFYHNKETNLGTCYPEMYVRMVSLKLILVEISIRKLETRTITSIFLHHNTKQVLYTHRFYYRALFVIFSPHIVFRVVIFIIFVALVKQWWLLSHKMNKRFHHACSSVMTFPNPTPRLEECIPYTDKTLQKSRLLKKPQQNMNIHFCRESDYFKDSHLNKYIV